MPAGQRHFHDPGIEHGSFRVLPITTGGFIVYDERRKPGKRQVGPVFRKLHEAEAAARTWHLQGHG